MPQPKWTEARKNALQWPVSTSVRILAPLLGWIQFSLTHNYQVSVGLTKWCTFVFLIQQVPCTRWRNGRLELIRIVFDNAPPQCMYLNSLSLVHHCSSCHGFNTLAWNTLPGDMVTYADHDLIYLYAPGIRTGRAKEWFFILRTM